MPKKRLRNISRRIIAITIPVVSFTDNERTSFPEKRYCEILHEILGWNRVALNFALKIDWIVDIMSLLKKCYLPTVPIL